MEKVSLIEYLIPYKKVKRKVIYHFSDSHLCEYDASSSIEEKERAIKQTEAWEGVRKGFCDAYGAPYGDLQKQPHAVHLNNLIKAASDGDALVIAGDTLDYISDANLRVSDSALGSIKIPYLAVCGNHEPVKDIHDGHEISKAKADIQTLDLGDMTIVGIENSGRAISKVQLDKLKALLLADKPLLIVMHVPIMTEGNRDRLLNSGVYFQLNYDGCPAENLEFIELIKQNSDKIIAVLAGHLHYSDISEIGNGVMQYVSSQGVTGNIYRYIIGE